VRTTSRAISYTLRPSRRPIFFSASNASALVIRRVAIMIPVPSPMALAVIVSSASWAERSSALVAPSARRWCSTSAIARSTSSRAMIESL